MGQNIWNRIRNNAYLLEGRQKGDEKLCSINWDVFCEGVKETQY